MTIREKLNSIAEERILILDGAMGSTIQALRLGELDFRGGRFEKHPILLEGCNDLLCLTKPETIGEIHDSFLEAGADIIETCSFNSTGISLSDYGLGQLSYEISAAAASIARKSADKFSTDDKPRFVAGSIGPTAKGASICTDVNDPGRRSIRWDELEAAYYSHAKGLLDGGVDIFLVETVFDTVNAKAALFAINRLLEEKNIDVPVMVSASLLGESGQLLSGQSLKAFFASVFNMPVNGKPPWAVGLNCSLNVRKLMPFVRALSAIAPCHVSACPNAGLPSKSGAYYEETPDIMSINIEDYFKEGIVNIIGSCCGSIPAHTLEIAKKAAAYKPRNFPANPQRIFFTGNEPLILEDNKIYMGADKLTPQLENGEYEDAADTARDMIEKERIQVINIKTDNEKTLNGFLDYALMNPYVAKAPFFINSASLKVLQAGLKRLQGRSLAGPVGLEDGENELLRRAALIRSYGAAVFVKLTDKGGREEAKKVYELLVKNGFPAESIVFEGSCVIDNCPGAFFAI
jgi:5-methyltetrahydrofolate--homocysteine methyltransferase